MGFPGGSDGKESTCNVGDLSSIPELGRSPGEEKGYPHQYSGLEISRYYSPWSLKESDMTDFHFKTLWFCNDHEEIFLSNFKMHV